jgi:hypothetical protein
LATEERNWLRAALRTARPDHDWIGRL